MSITFFETPGALKRFFKRRWAHQETFATPLKRLDSFVGGVVASLEPIEGGLATLGEVTAEPRTLNALLTRHGITPQPLKNTRHFHDWTASATGRGEVKQVLEALLADPIDFLFVPSPGKFMVYADHDEYTIFLSNARGSLSAVSRALSKLGFERLHDHQRPLP